MIIVRLPQEIKQFKEIVALGLTWRQLLFSIAGIAAAVGVGFLLQGKLNDTIFKLIVVSVGMLFGAFGFFKKNGMTFEQYLFVMFRFFVQPTTLKQKFLTGKEELITEEYESLKKEYSALKVKKGGTSNVF